MDGALPTPKVSAAGTTCAKRGMGGVVVLAPIGDVHLPATNRKEAGLRAGARWAGHWGGLRRGLAQLEGVVVGVLYGGDVRIIERKWEDSSKSKKKGGRHGGRSGVAG